MDNKVFNLKKSVQYKKTTLTKNDIKKIIQDNSEELLGLKIIALNYFINKDSNDYIETLGIDINNQMVIIEYRMGKFTRVINNSLVYIDYIKDHISEFKMLVHEKYPLVSSKVNYNARLIVIGEYFHKDDGESIKKMPYNISLITFTIFNKDLLLLTKTYVSRNIDFSLFNYKLSIDEKELFLELNDFITSLGEEIVEYGYNNIITVSKINPFAYIVFNQGLYLGFDNKNDNLKLINQKNIDKIYKEIEKAYDKN